MTVTVSKKTIVIVTISLLLIFALAFCSRSSDNKSVTAQAKVETVTEKTKTVTVTTSPIKLKEGVDEPANEVYVLVVGLLFIGAIMLFLYSMHRKRPGSYWEKSWRWVAEREWKTVLQWIGGLALLNYTVYLSFPERWNDIHQSKFFWPVHGVVIVIITFFTKSVFEKGEKTTKLHILAKLTLWVIVFGIGVNVWNWYDGKYNLPKDTKFGQQAGVSPQAEGLPLPSVNSEGAKRVREAFKNDGFSDEEAEKMVSISGRESGWNQFESDGSTPLRGRENPKDIGIMQINEGWWQKEISLDSTDRLSSLDLSTESGNLQAAIHLRKKYGMVPWKATSGFKQAFARADEIHVRIAKVGEWSEPVQLNGRSSTIWYGGDVYRMDENGVITETGPYSKSHLGPVRSLKYRSRESVPVTITIVFN